MWTTPAAFVEMVIIKVLAITQNFHLVMVNLASMHLYIFQFKNTTANDNRLRYFGLLDSYIISIKIVNKQCYMNNELMRKYFSKKLNNDKLYKSDILNLENV